MAESTISQQDRFFNHLRGFLGHWCWTYKGNLMYVLWVREIFYVILVHRFKIYEPVTYFGFWVVNYLWKSGLGTFWPDSVGEVSGNWI